MVKLLLADNSIYDISYELYQTIPALPPLESDLNSNIKINLTYTDASNTRQLLNYISNIEPILPQSIILKIDILLVSLYLQLDNIITELIDGIATKLNDYRSIKDNKDNIINSLSELPVGIQYEICNKMNRFYKCFKFDRPIEHTNENFTVFSERRVDEIVIYNVNKDCKYIANKCYAINDLSNNYISGEIYNNDVRIHTITSSDDVIYVDKSNRIIKINKDERNVIKEAKINIFALSTDGDRYMITDFEFNEVIHHYFQCDVDICSIYNNNTITKDGFIGQNVFICPNLIFMVSIDRFDKILNIYNFIEGTTFKIENGSYIPLNPTKLYSSFSGKHLLIRYLDGTMSIVDTFTGKIVSESDPTFKSHDILNSMAISDTGIYLLYDIYGNNHHHEFRVYEVRFIYIPFKDNNGYIDMSMDKSYDIDIYKSEPCNRKDYVSIIVRSESYVIVRGTILDKNNSNIRSRVYKMCDGSLIDRLKCQID